MQKCVKVQSKKLNQEQIDEVVSLCASTQKCRDYLYDRFSGIRFMSQVKKARKMRDMLRKEEEERGISYADMFGFQQRNWVMTLFDVCANINANWSNLATKLKVKFRDNETMSEDEKAYCRYIVSSREYWQSVLLEEAIVPNKTLTRLLEKIEPSRLKTIHNIIRRYTRNHRFKKPKSKKVTNIYLDQDMYTIEYDKKEDKTYLEFITKNKRKRMKVELKSPYSYDKNGNIRLVYLKDKKCVEIHKVIDVNPKKNDNPVNVIGTDKGYATLLSCSNHTEYGVGIGRDFTKEAERLNKRNSNRNPYIQKQKEMKNSIQVLSRQIDNTTAGVERIRLIQQKKAMEKELREFEEHHIGNKIYDRQHARATAHLESTINHEIKQMIHQTGMTHLALEDLSFTRDKKPKKGRKFNRLMTNWIKGILDERLLYVSELNGVKVSKVNAAYTSQYCAYCGAKIERSGAHHEIATCPKCGEMDANINAAKQIFLRFFDDEITLYTPYKKVKEIMEARNKPKYVTYKQMIQYVKSK